MAKKAKGNRVQVILSAPSTKPAVSLVQAVILP